MEKRNVFGEERASCVVPMSLSDTVLREPLKVANAAQTDKSEPHSKEYSTLHDT